VARSIPLPYWRFSALQHVAAELLRWERECAAVSAATSRDYRDQALRLLREIEENLPSIPEEDGDRAAVLCGVGLSLINAGELEWAERLSAATQYCGENTDVLLKSAKVRASRGQPEQAMELAKTVAGLATKGPGDLVNRAIDLKNVAELIFEFGDKADARKCLEEAARIALASQEAHDIDGCKILGVIAVAFARHGYVDQARETADRITQPARRDQALKRIEELHLHP